jgi:HAD superfamily hydrolase (TIGR01509 family)
MRLDSLDNDQIRGLCFDVDGTLRDTDDQLEDQIYHRIRWLGKAIPEQKLKTFSRKIVMAVEDPGNFLLTSLDFLGIDDRLATIGAFINDLGLMKPRTHTLVPGTIETLHALKHHFPMAIVSARNQLGTQSFLDRFELNEFFVCVVHGQTCRHTKPYPDPVLYAARQMGIPAQACVMIGDTRVDVRAGKAAGSQTVAVLSGFGERDELEKAGANLILSSIADLPDVLLNA